MMFVRTGWKALCVGVVVCGVSAAFGQPPFVRNLTGFEAGEGFLTTDEVIWMEPLWSGTTVRYANTSGLEEPDGIWKEGADQFGTPWSEAQVVDWGAFAGTQSYVIYFIWGNPLDTDDPPGFTGAPSTGGNDLIRCTTWAAANLQRPSVHLGGKIKFKMAVLAYADELYTPIPGGETASILVSLGIRETGNFVAQGDPDFGGGDIEWVYMQGSEVIPAATNGVLPQLPNDDPDYPYRTTPPGGKRFNATATWPPPTGDWYSVEFDLANLAAVRGFANNTTAPDTAGDGILDAATWGIGDGVNRGVLENIAFTNDPTDIYGAFFFIWIDDVVLESPEPDPLLPPSIQAPVFDTATEVRVDCHEDATEAELFLNDVSVGTAVPDINDVATFPFGSGELQVGDVLKATQTVYGVTSDFSAPVVVFAEGTALADNFDGYTTQEELNALWSDSINFPSPPDAKLLLATGSAASCDNILKEANPSGSDAARLYRKFGNLNGSDADPLWLTVYYRHVNDNTNARDRFLLSRYTDGQWSVGDPANGSTGFGITNGIAGDFLTQYNILLFTEDPPTVNSNGFQNDYFGVRHQYATTGVTREDGVWHKFQVQVRSNYLNYYIDDQLVNPPAFTIAGGAGTNGVPRPDPGPYQFVVLGMGWSNNGVTYSYDNISVTIGDTSLPFGPPNPVSSPDVVGPLFPGDTLVTVENVNSNALEVAVYRNAETTPIATTNGVGAFLDNTATLAVPALADGDVITATQTLSIARALAESCLSAPVVVAVPAVTVEPVLVPGQTTVEVSNLEEGLAGQVTVYRVLGPDTKEILGFEPNPATEPVTVGVTALINGDTIVATQTIGGVEGPDSASVQVAVPAPTLPGPLSVGDTVVTVSDVNPLATDVTVYVNGNTSGITDVSTSGATTVDVSLASSLFVGDDVWATQTIEEIEGPQSNTITVELPMCLMVFSDDFETNTSANWNVNLHDNGAEGDAAATFAYDYSADAVPPSPNGGGATRGLKFEANQGGVAASAAITVSPIGYSFVSSNGYRLVFDMWINANGPFPAGGTGSTEFFTAGVGYDDTTVNMEYVSGIGGWFSITGESGSSRDVRPFKDMEEQWPASGQFHAGTGTYANNTNYHQFYFDLFGTPSPPPAQAVLHPNQVGNLAQGSAGFAWHEVSITAIGTKARWEINGVPVVTLDATIGNPFSGLDGNVSIGYWDLFTSLSDNPAMSFGLADNVRILVPHTPGTGGDYDGDVDVDLIDYWYFADCMTAPGGQPAPASGLNCMNTCLEAFDADSDGDVDLEDFADFQDNFTG